MTRLTISIVNYNAGDYLSRCLQSIENLRDEAELSVIVSDNNSTDESVEDARKRFPSVEFRMSKENLGFGKAHNRVLRELKDEFVLLLNPDTELDKGAIAGVLSVLEADSTVGVATCKIVHQDGKLDWAAHRGFPDPWASLLYFLGNDSLYHLSKCNMNIVHDVDCVSGSFLMTRRSVLEKIGLFDEDYFMYAEDIDICFRIKKAGYRVLYVPDVKMLHYKGVSSGLKDHSQAISTATRETRLRSLNAFYETTKIFYKKHYEKEYPAIVNWLVYFGINLKWWLSKRKLTV